MAVTPSSITHSQTLDAADGTVLITAGPAALEHSHVLEHANLFFLEFPLYLAAPSETVRELTWDILHAADDTVWQIITDGESYAQTAQTEYELPATVEVREILRVGIGGPYAEWEDLLETPLDIVELSWTTTVKEGGYFQIQRRDVGDAAWTDITQVSRNASTYTDGPLEDGDYEYRVVAVDAEGDEIASASVAITISSAPEPPADLTATVEEVTV